MRASPGLLEESVREGGSGLLGGEAPGDVG